MAHQIVNLGQKNDYSLSLPIYHYFVLYQILALTTVLPFVAEHTHNNAACISRNEKHCIGALPTLSFACLWFCLRIKLDQNKVMIFLIIVNILFLLPLLGTKLLIQCIH